MKRHVLRLDLSGEVFATFREAMAKIRRDAGEALDDDAAILLLCRQALEGPKDPGRSSYQIALTVCESCRRATQQGRGELIEVCPEIVEMAECDGQHIGHLNAQAGASAPEQVGGTGMGFREGDAKRAFARIPHSVSSLEQLIRLALRELASQ